MTSVPTATTNRLPSYLAPLPRRVEDLALRYAWAIVAINLAGTAFGFWYYRFQLAQTPIVMWPFVPDSPAATLFVALSLAAWKLDYDVEWLHMLAFFGNIKLGLWTPFVQLVLNGAGDIEPWLYWFLIVSHLAMSLQSFLIYRYAEFSVSAVAVATVWYGLNDIVDYFAPLVGEFHHTFLRAELVNGIIDHSGQAHDFAAAAAVTLTLAATFLALATRIKKLEPSGDPSKRGLD
ncbi:MULTISPECIES: DUF1405 domain-containing protein [Halobacteriales]|jgi:uncharacterized membrane protein YpjA|uniref:DUF1405 domain-containing protein n=2 Tax=Halobacteriales TaxID=2235 RepID=A0ABU2G7N1_9EURY|nr:MULTISPECIES: DUF1405 domain-containing protein [Halobacteria]MBP2252522.1 putative membrane protein YpjA [Halarchaeum solikamskense]MDS0284276.1 DUF1405 domain-containing protein [Halomicroarcula sp. S3CR25-11]MDS0296797.1 DUF1405 domain-containing protein [Halogeometricum sp. S3BR5-2]